MKKGIILIAFLLIGLSVSAQTKNKLFTPVTYSQLVNEIGVKGVDKVADGAFILRFQATLAATVSKYDSETKKVVSTPLSRIGGGLSYAHYIPVDGVPVNNYSFNGLVLIPTDAITSMGIALTASIFHVDAGVVYDFVKGKKFKDNIGFLTGVSLTF
jgi:hypothetical protein